MAGTASIAVDSNKDGMKVSYTFDADASGDCDDANGAFTAHGFLIGVQVNPNDASDLFDLVLNDDDSLDVLDGSGANLSNAAGMTLAEKYLHPQGPNGNYLYFFGDTLTPVVSNAGNSGGGTIHFKFSRRVG